MRKCKVVKRERIPYYANFYVSITIFRDFTALPPPPPPPQLYPKYPDPEWVKCKLVQPFFLTQVK